MAAAIPGAVPAAAPVAAIPGGGPWGCAPCPHPGGGPCGCCHPWGGPLGLLHAHGEPDRHGLGPRLRGRHARGRPRRLRLLRRGRLLRRLWRGSGRRGDRRRGCRRPPGAPLEGVVVEQLREPDGPEQRLERRAVAPVVVGDGRAHRGRPRRQRAHLLHAGGELDLLHGRVVVGVGGDDGQRAGLVVVEHREHAVEIGGAERDALQHARLDHRLGELLGGDEAGVVGGGDELEEVGLGEQLEVDERLLDPALLSPRVLDRVLVILALDPPLGEQPIRDALVDTGETSVGHQGAGPEDGEATTAPPRPNIPAVPRRREGIAKRPEGLRPRAPRGVSCPVPRESPRCSRAPGPADQP